MFLRPRHVVLAMLAAGALPALALQACSGCGSTDSVSAVPSSDAADAAEDANHEGAVEADAATEHDATMDEAAVIPLDAYPDTVPTGWEAWTGWSAECPLYVPGPNAEMPPAIEWEACPDPVPQTLACRRMKDTWSTKGYGIGYHPKLTMEDGTGIPILFFLRTYVGGDVTRSYVVAAEADGPVRSAAYNARSSDCGYMEESLAPRSYVLFVHTPTGVNGSAEYGAVAGKLTERSPSIAFRPPDPSEPSDWYHSDQWLVRFILGKHTAWSWDLTTSHTVYYAGDDPENMPPHEAIVVGGDVFTSVNTSVHCGVMSWNLQNGSRPLLRYFGDSTRGAGNFGTDGKDMVWTYAEGATACDHESDKREVWTAPYTTDPAQLQATAHRLRTDVRGMDAHPYVVGFGFAMRPSSAATNNLWVVRLSDGVSWLIEGSTNTDALSFNNVLGFTQDELFATAAMQSGGLDGITIVRIRLDSLGPGTPPD